MEKAIFELKGMIDMLECMYETDQTITYGQFEMIKDKVNELADTVEQTGSLT